MSYGKKVMTLQRPPRIFGMPTRTTCAQDQPPWDCKREKWKTTGEWSGCGAQIGWLVFGFVLLGPHTDPTTKTCPSWSSLVRKSLQEQTNHCSKITTPAPCWLFRGQGCLSRGGFDRFKEMITHCVSGCPKILIH